MKKIVIFIVLLGILTGCSNAKELEKLGYPEAIVNKIEATEVADKLISNKVSYEDFLLIVGNDSYINENMEAYAYVYNKFFIKLEISEMIGFVNSYERTSGSVLELEEVLATADKVKILKGIKGYKDKNLELYIYTSTALEEAMDDEVIIMAVNTYGDKGRTKEELLAYEGDPLRVELENYLEPTLEIKEKVIDYNSKASSMDIIKKIVIAKSLFDGNISNEIEFLSEFNGSVLGKQNLHIRVIDSKGFTSTLEEEVTVSDREKPVLKGIGALTVFEGDEIDLLEGVVASDNYDGDISDDVTLNDNNVNRDSHGIYEIEYKVRDSNGNEAVKSRTLEILSRKEIGEAFDLNLYEIQVKSYKVNRIDSEPASGYYSYYTADDGNTYLITTVYMKNLDTIPRQPFETFGNDDHRIDAEIIIDGDIVYGHVAHSTDNNWYDYSTTLRAGSYKTRRLTFEVSKEVYDKASTIMMKLMSYSNEDQATYVKLK